ncbi:NACHT, LRR and PYD domains-containing protein 14-like [Eucyclogobius newberryi]|uniref:NACHT, LRR and PYD domains-containing protein 14-like n=1 Tax=Eucyclogobius newberryi TaxID=166745 RepID=UPI003B5A13EC
MDLQSHLKVLLRDKYQNVNDLVLPINLRFRNTRDLPHFATHYSRHIDQSHLDAFEDFLSCSFEDLLKCTCNHGRSQRTVLTFGAPGIGKTTAVQKCVLDWAEGRAHTHIDLLFPIPCWELSLLENEKLSLIQLLKLFFPDLRELSAKRLSGKTVWFVFDELGDLDDTLDWPHPKVGNVNQVTLVENLLPNLLKGKLLPNAHIWITTRYAAIDYINQRFVLRETEMHGFNDEQKEQHIMKLVGDEVLADRVIDHIKISRSLDRLCQIPYMCTVMATVLKKRVKTNDYKIRPMTLTQIYSSLIDHSLYDFILGLSIFKDQSLAYYFCWTSEESLNEMTVAEPSTFAREYPLVFREEKSVRGVSMFRFAHLSILEYFVAMAKLNEETTMNPPEEYSTAFLKMIDKAERDCNHGQFDICFRFFFGLLKERGILQISDPFFVEIREEMLYYYYDNTNVNRFHWLREFDSQALLNDVEIFQNTGWYPFDNLTLEAWLTIYLMIVNVEGMDATIELELSMRCDEKVCRCVRELLKARKALLGFSNLSDACCPALASVLGTKESHLRKLDLGFNSITDRGVESLVLGLSDQDCRLMSLRLHGCELTSSACEPLASALKLCPKLKELDLSCNSIGDVGLKHLARGLESPKCQLETLRLSQCNIKKAGGFHLASALEKNPAHLKWLDLSINKIGNAAANELFTKFDISRLRKLEIYYCGLTERCCARISDALKLEESNLVELNLSSNNVKDAGAYLISSGLFAWSRLEKLNISRCGITQMGGFYLSKVLSCISALYSNDMQMKIGWQATELREMDLSLNKLTDDGAGYLSTGFKNPYSHLQRLSLVDCSLTCDCCSDLASQLSSSECLLSELDLSSNYIQDGGVKRLCVALKSPQCSLQKLFLRNCGFSSRCVPFLNTALKTNRHLTELYLMGNKLDDGSIKVLLDMTRSDAYKLNTVDVSID